MYRWITNTYETIELFVFYKKYILIIGSGLIVMSSWVRDVCMLHQPDWGYYRQSNQIATCKGESCKWRLHRNFRKAIFVFLRTKTLLRNSYITLACLMFANIIKMPFGLSCVRSFQWLCTPIQKGKKILTRVERGTMIVKKLGGSSNWSPSN